MYQILLFIAAIYIAIYLLKAIITILLVAINWDGVEKKLIWMLLEVILLIIPSLCVLLHYMVTQVLF
jgi:hypothetical protein